MDIEHLNKSQIVLLTLFTSFVTSIATGIVTFSLMQQAPATVTQTVNHIIERTVEKAIPGKVTALTAAPAQTIVVKEKESESLANAVQTATPSIVRIYTRDTDDQKFLGLGVVLTASGLLATDASILGESADAIAMAHNGVRVRIFVQQRDPLSGIALLTATTSPNEPAPAWKPIGIAGASAVLGTSVVALSGQSTTRLGAGIIAGLEPLSGNAGAKTLIIDTSIATGNISPGSPLIDANGSLVGLSTHVARTVSPSAFMPASALTADPQPATGQSQ